MKILNVIVFFFIFYGILLSCNIQKQEKPLPLPSTIPENISLFVSSDVRGSLEPCGCKSGQMGGLPRQAQYFVQHRNEHDLLLDIGNSMAVQANDYELFKWYYVLLTYEKMRYDAVNLGQNEIQLNNTQITNLRQKIPVPLISANVSDKNGQPLVLPYIIQQKGNIKVAISGVVTAGEKVGEGITILPAIPALSKYLPKMIQESHLVIILANLPDEQIEELATRFPQIGIICNTGTKTTFVPKKVGPVVVSNLTELGRYIQKINFSFKQDGDLAWMKVENVRLGNDISDHPGTVHLLNRYRQELAEKRFHIIQERKNTEKFAGSDRCSLCHSEIYNSWKKTAHSHSLDSLKRKNNQHDPQCLKCHVTGLGHVSGYVSETETPDMARIGCEMCHGQSYRHAYHNNPNQHRSSPGNPNPKETCLECHTWDHCGDFDFATFWNRISHPKHE